MNRRSDLFMLVYGLTLLIASYIANDEQMSKLVLAASISGVFFAFSDLCLGQINDIQTKLNKIENSLILAEKCVLDGTKTVGECSEAENFLKNPDGLSQRKGQIQKLQKEVTAIIRIGKVCFALGVFLFLMITICYDRANQWFLRLDDIADKMTIISFATVILSYWFQDRCMEYEHRKIDKLYNNGEK